MPDFDGGNQIADSLPALIKPDEGSVIGAGRLINWGDFSKYRHAVHLKVFGAFAMVVIISTKTKI